MDICTPLSQFSEDGYHIPPMESPDTSEVQMLRQLHKALGAFPDIYHKSRRRIRSGGSLSQQQPLA